MGTQQEYDKFLANYCNKLAYGECHNAGCLRRGGYERCKGMSHDLATCVAYEIAQELKRTAQ